jgi:ActR/RegA family two-component response regulator
MKIFELFYTTKPNHEGLGLSTALSIVKNHNGNIIVNSKPFKGSKFSVFLPKSRNMPETNVKAKSYTKTKDISKHHNLENLEFHYSDKKILILEDDKAVSDFLKRITKKYGIEAVFVETGEEALSIYSNAVQSEDPFDLVIFDLTIENGLGGDITFQKLRDQYLNVKGIVSSGYSDSEVLSNYKKYGFLGIIKKPYQASRFINKLNEIFDHM